MGNGKNEELVQGKMEGNIRSLGIETWERSKYMSLGYMENGL